MNGVVWFQSGHNTSSADDCSLSPFVPRTDGSCMRNFHQSVWLWPGRKSCFIYVVLFLFLVTFWIMQDLRRDELTFVCLVLAVDLTLRTHLTMCPVLLWAARRPRLVSVCFPDQAVDCLAAEQVNECQAPTNWWFSNTTAWECYRYYPLSSMAKELVLWRRSLLQKHRIVE